MSQPWQRALTASLMMILASLAGCLDAEDVGGEASDAYGTVVVSTYHIAELVSAVGGDLVNVEMISTTNIPVHDYEPAAQDIIRLQGADVFLYHGLGLEPWVEDIIDTMGADAPTASATHAMPSGEETLDFESILIGDLCRYLNSPSTTDVHHLAEHAEEADELHAEDGAYNLAMPEHDEHEHADDGLVEPEETMSLTDSECPAGTTVSIYHLEEGEYVLEFETEDFESFTMALAAMGGGHAHHDHGGDEHDEHGVCHDMSTHENHDEYEDKESCEAAGYLWMEDDHDEDMSAADVLDLFDADGDDHLSLEEFIDAMEAMEEEEDDHDHGEDSNETHGDNETSEHGDDHGDNETSEHGDDHGDIEHELEMAMFEHLFTEADSDGDTLLDLAELEELEHMMDEMDDDIGPEMMIGVYMSVFDEDDNNVLSLAEFTEMMDAMMSMEGDEDEHDEHDESEHEEDDHHDDEPGEEENMTEYSEMMFTMFDANEDGSLDMDEMMSLADMMDDEHEQEGAGSIHLHVEREGEYGIALPEGVSIHVLSEEGHEGHDHGHDEEEGDHNDEEDDHSDEEDAHADHGDDDALSFDPHSWLNPMAFSAQIDVVLDVLSTNFPDGAEAFEANANAYKAELLALDGEFEAAFGDNGTCDANTVAANHNAYAYLADAYDLEFVTVHGLDPEGEPTAEDIAEVVERVTEDGITVLFVEEYTDEAAVASLVQQTVSDDMPEGLTVLTLYTMELAPMDSDDDYMSLMTKNFENLKSGLGC
jgi:ABC-type Zn uptake system ZnuABC Zn-binding protein ZnuA/Ca2+-binding EF-hand superfamily protein